MNTTFVAGEKEAALPFLTKLYVWSIVLEPLLYFVVAGRSLVGISGNISRLLQLFVILIFAFKFCVRQTRLVIPNPIGSDYRPYFLFLVFAVLSGISGVVGGAYVLTNIYFYTYENSSVFSTILNSPSFRPFFEYFIYIYYFVYFVIMPKYLIKSREGINYFFKIFVFLYVASLVLGYVDFLLDAVNINFLTRHVYDTSVFVSGRFHGLAGEPRDAFVYLALGIVIIYLRQIWDSRKYLSAFVLFWIFLAAVLTQSFSGILGTGISALLILVYFINQVSLRHLKYFICFLFLIVALSFLMIEYSERINLYITSVMAIFRILETGGQIPPVLTGQMQNIYPIWERYTEIREFNFVNLFLGTGIGSSSVINNNLGFFGNEMMNPHSQLIRTLYETGLVGLMLFIYAFLKPIKLNIDNDNLYMKLKFMMLFLLGLFFSHRSSSPYIFLGILLLVSNYLHEERDAEKSKNGF